MDRWQEIQALGDAHEGTRMHWASVTKDDLWWLIAEVKRLRKIEDALQRWCDNSEFTDSNLIDAFCDSQPNGLVSSNPRPEGGND